MAKVGFAEVRDRQAKATDSGDRATTKTFIDDTWPALERKLTEENHFWIAVVDDEEELTSINQKELEDVARKLKIAPERADTKAALIKLTLQTSMNQKELKDELRKKQKIAPKMMKELFDECDEADDAKAALIELNIMTSMTQKELINEAKKMKIPLEKIKECDEADDAKAALIKLSLIKLIQKEKERKNDGNALSRIVTPDEKNGKALSRIVTPDEKNGEALSRTVTPEWKNGEALSRIVTPDEMLFPEYQSEDR